MSLALNILLYLSTILLIIIILFQPHKSEGLSAYDTSESVVFGVSPQGGPIVRITAFLAIFIAILVVGMHYFL